MAQSELKEYVDLVFQNLREEHGGADAAAPSTGQPAPFRALAISSGRSTNFWEVWPRRRERPFSSI